MIRIIVFLSIILLSAKSMASTCLQSPSAFKQDALPVILSSNASEDKLRDTLSSIIDFNSIAERSLEKQWKQVEESKREDFKQTLQTLMVNNYVARFKGNVKDQNFEWVFVDCKTCFIKIHSECLKYYGTHKLNYESCSDCVKYLNY